MERDDEAIDRWVKQQVKEGTAPERADRVRRRVRGVTAALGAGHLGAPGHTLVLRHRFNWKRLSLAGVLVHEPDGSDAHPVFQPRRGAYNDETLIAFVSD